VEELKNLHRYRERSALGSRCDYRSLILYLHPHIVSNIGTPTYTIFRSLKIQEQVQTSPSFIDTELWGFNSYSRVFKSKEVIARAINEVVAVISRRYRSDRREGASGTTITV
jgi:hypothetical protein